VNAAGSVIAVALGLGTWLVTATVVGKTEAWDDPAYFQVALPALFAAIFVLGIVFPKRAWRWGPLAMAGQVLALLFSGNGSLLPLGIILMGVMSLPYILAGWLGSLLRKREPDAPPGAPGPAAPDSR